jgi:hypothetical protein
MTRLAVAVNVSFLAAVFSVTFTKLESERLGGLSLVDVLTVIFVGLFLAERCAHASARFRASRGTLAAFGVVLVAIYLAKRHFAGRPFSALMQFGKAGPGSRSPLRVARLPGVACPPSTAAGVFIGGRSGRSAPGSL